MASVGSTPTRATLPKNRCPMPGCDVRLRDRDLAALETVVASRPLKPPPLHVAEARISPAAVEARKAARREAVATFAQLPTVRTVEAPEPKRPEIAIAHRTTTTLPNGE
jgi:hypothetical protein